MLDLFFRICTTLDSDIVIHISTLSARHTKTPYTHSSRDHSHVSFNHITHTRRCRAVMCVRADIVCAGIARDRLHVHKHTHIRTPYALCAQNTKTPLKRCTDHTTGCFDTNTRAHTHTHTHSHSHVLWPTFVGHTSAPRRTHKGAHRSVWYARTNALALRTRTRIIRQPVRPVALCQTAHTHTQTHTPVPRRSSHTRDWLCALTIPRIHISLTRVSIYISGGVSCARNHAHTRTHFECFSNCTRNCNKKKEEKRKRNSRT